MRKKITRPHHAGSYHRIIVGINGILKHMHKQHKINIQIYNSYKWCCYRYVGLSTVNNVNTHSIIVECAIDR